MWSVEQDGRYRVLRALGSGGMAEVVLAEDVALGRWVALKRLRKAHDPESVRRLRREAIVGASIDHPNLVRIFDVHEKEDGDVVIVMEYVAGDTLHQLIRARGRIRPSKALQILAGIAAGLDAVHARGIVHRDVKPANILLGLDGSIKLADLGVAAIDDGTKITTADQVIGTFSYMALEQLEGKPPTPAMDIYALGAVAFEMLTGRKARAEPNPVALAHAIATRSAPDLRDRWSQAPAAAALALKRAMASDPAQRPRTAGELLGRLREALEPEVTEEATASEPVAAELAGAEQADTAAPAKRSAAAAAAPAAAVAVAAARPSPPRHGAVALADPPRRRPPLRSEPPPASVPPRPSAPTGVLRPERPRLRFDRARVLAAVGLAVAVAAIAFAVASLTSGGNASKQRNAATPPAHRHTTTTPPRRPGTAHRSPAPTKATTTGAARATTAPATKPASSASAAAPAAVGATASAITPAGAVEAFYEASARHDYADAWSLADSNMRAQLAGYPSFQGQMSRVRSIQFHQAQAVVQGSATATVAVETTAVLADRTQLCSGRVQTIRTEQGRWLLDHISISCVPE